MKLYEINEEINNLIDQILVDEETGEILCDIDTIYARIDALQMEKKSILEFLAKLSVLFSPERSVWVRPYVFRKNP